MCYTKAEQAELEKEKAAEDEDEALGSRWMGTFFGAPKNVKCLLVCSLDGYGWMSMNMFGSL